MLLGKLRRGGYSTLSGSSPKSAPSAGVAPTSAFSIPGIYNPPTVETRTEFVTLPKAVATNGTVQTPIPPASTDEDIPEIVVTGQRIPWYAWALAGVAGFAVLDKLLGRK